MATQQENPDKGLLMIGAVAGVSFFWCFLPFSSERSDPDTPSPYGDWPLAPLLPQFAGPHNAGGGMWLSEAAQTADCVQSTEGG